MSRYSYVLQSITNKKKSLIGIFPFNALIDFENSSLSGGKLEFYESAIEGLKLLAQKQTKVILFVNQFKQHPLSYDQFNALNQAVEGFIRQHGVQVEGFYWCPVSDKKDPFVVPNSGMFSRATENQQINWEGIPVISSFDNDLVAASKVKADPIKIGKGSEKWTLFEDFYEYAKTIN